DDLAHTFDGLRCAIVYTFHPSAEYRGLGQCGDLYARRTNVYAENRRAIDLRRTVETLGRGADQLEILRLLQRDFLRHWQARGVGCNLRIADPSARRRMKDFTAACAAGRGIDIPALCRGSDEHRSRSRTGFAQG